jgi:hypothetical protein
VVNVLTLMLAGVEAEKTPPEVVAGRIMRPGSRT